MPQRNEPIAVIGSACRFPGKTDTPSKLWELLKQPSDLLKTIPSSRFNAESWYHPDNAHHGTSNVTKSYFLEEDVAAFDAQFFNIPPNECEAVDPQQRMLMETVFDSLCAAGIPMEKLRGTPTACYVGQMCDDWSGILMKDWDSIPQYAATGISRSIMSNRVSYFFDWHGPSMTIDTACSSSLVAVHEAVNVLRSGDSNVAVACGANLILSPGMYIAESKLKMLSPDGRSRMWDQGANGYARGEGLAAVVLKTLSQAIADGDHIDCIIRETGFNQDGRTTGITMPSNLAQASLIRDTYKKAGLDPQNPKDRPQFFHAHGTGTPAGDPQEAEAISRSFFKDGEKSDDKLFIGSIKTVIGHTEGTAGLASLIGTAMAMRNKTIPPNMHFENLAEKVAPFYTNLEVPVAAKSWPAAAAGQPLRASVNSFGFGGANAHAILESYEPTEQSTVNADVPLFTPFTFSANNEKSLRRMLESFSEYLTTSQPTNLRDIAWTLQNRRSALAQKVSVAGRSVADLIESIDAAAAEENLGSRSTISKQPEILGIFTGQGAQWPTMGKELIASSPYVANVIALMDKSLQELPEADRPSWSIAAELQAVGKSSRLSEAALSQPLCTAVQVALVDLVKAAGIKFKAVVGHSSGEIAAAYAAGFVNAYDAIRIAYYRGVYAKLAASSSGAKGAMMAVGTSLEDAQEFCELEQFEGRLTVAASNAAASVTLSGDDEAINEAEEIFKDESKFARKLRVDTAYHSFHMLPCSGPYLEAMERCNVNYKEGTEATWYSSVTGSTKMTKESINGQYWVDNMKNTVLFSQAVQTAAKDCGSFDLAVELGPHPALKGPALENIEAALGAAGTPYTGVLSRGTDDVKAFSNALGYIWENFGPAAVDFESYDKLVSGVAEEKKQPVGDLPSYPFDHDTTYWTGTRVSASYKTREAGPHPVLGVQLAEGTTSQQVQWRNILSPREIPWMSGHRLQGQVVFPASGYVAMALEAIMTQKGDHSVQLVELTDFVIGKAISFLDDQTNIEIVLTLTITSSTSEAVKADFQISSCPRGEHNMSLNANGSVSIRLGEQSKDMLHAVPTPTYNMSEIEIDRFYKSLTEMGYNYSAPFKAITSIQRRADTAVGEMTDVRGDGWEDNMLMHPGLVDTSFQTVFAAFSSPGDERLWALHVPTNIKRLAVNPNLAVFPPKQEAVWPWQSCITSGEESSPTADIEVFAENGKDVLLEIEGIKLVPLSQATKDNDEYLFSNFVYQLAKPDGVIASPNKPTEWDVKLAKDSERFSYHWIVQLLRAITPEDEANTLIHYQRMLKWCKFVHGQVVRGEHPYVGPEAENDSEEYVESLMTPYGKRSDIDLIRAVGKNLPHVIKTSGNIVEHMVKDGMLDAFYEEGLGLHIANTWEANLAEQAVHRYPGMKIIEIGGGTGGSTRMILPKLGNAFSSYTFTDISAGFFDAAEERFAEYADRMLFKTLDMDRDVLEQGYIEGDYDMILASNVLHAGPDLDFIMSNVRKLLKPGGLLINMEATTYFPSMRNGFSMAGLPGWWCGAETGRPWGPTLPVEEWDKLWKRTGWSGVDTYPPHLNDLHHFTVMVTQAVDDRINYLREPLALPPSSPKQQELVIIGGRTDSTTELASGIENILDAYYGTVTRTESLDTFASLEFENAPVVISLNELDTPIMQELMEDQPDKLESMKSLFSRASDVLWITQNNRTSPYARMVIGMARTLVKEYPGINFQSVDVDVLDENSATLFSECFLRHQQLLEWNNELEAGTIHWSEEPELHLVDGRFYIPRLKPVQEMNDRYNSTRRSITHSVDPAVSKVELAANGDSYELREPSPIKLAEPIENGVTVRVSKSLLQAVKIPGAGHYALVYGTTEAGETVLALSDSRESVVEVPKTSTIPYSGKVDAAQVVLSTAANLVANVVLAGASPNTTLLAHEPDAAVASALTKQGNSKRVKVILTTTSTEKKGANWTYLHPEAPARMLKKTLPKDISTFANFSEGQDKQLIADISEMLPYGCTVSNQTTAFARTLNTAAAATPAVVAEHLTKGWNAAKASNFAVPTSRPTVALQEVSQVSGSVGQLAVVDWTVDAEVEVPVNVRPIDEAGNLFKGDKTYLMVGLSGEVGQSLTQWMVKNGARHVVLTSRNPRVNEDWIESLEEDYGANVRTMSLDITNRDALHKCYNKITRTMPEIAGVGHGAMVLTDALFQNMDYEDLMRVLRPKVLGAIYLDELFSEATLDFFILFSSITGVVGNTGQSNYIASNFFLEALGLSRRQRGLVASVIGISSLVGIGYVERSEGFDADHFKRLGYRNVSEQDVQVLFAEAIHRGRPGVSAPHEIITGVVPRFAGQDGIAAYLQDVKFNHLILERTSDKLDGDSSTSVPVRVQLESATTEDEIHEILETGFTRRVKKILRVPEENEFSASVSLVEQGVDSLVAVEIRSWFLKEIDVDIPVLKVLGGASITDLIIEARQRLTPEATPALGTEAAPKPKKTEASKAAPAPKAKVPETVPDIQLASPSPNESSQKQDMQSLNSFFTPKVETATPKKDTKKDEADKEFEALKKTEVTERMSFGQSRFWFLNQALEDKTTFNMAIMVKLDGKLRVKDLEFAVQAVSLRHEALRTRYFSTGEYMENPVQGIIPTSTVKLTTKNIKKDSEAHDELEKVRSHVWALDRWDVMKVELLSLSDTKHYFIIGCHHIAMDGFSFNVFFADLEKAYKGTKLSILPSASQYRGFARQQHQDWENGKLKEDIDYYRGIIPKGLKAIPLLPFASTNTRTPLNTYGANKVEARIEASLTNKIKAASRKMKCTTFHFYLTTLEILMFRLLDDCDEFMIGVADANRVDDKYMQTLGFLLNLLPLHFERKGAATFGQAIQQARNKVYGGLVHSKLPFNTLLEQLDIPRSAAHTPLFQIFCDYRQGVQERQKYMGIKAEGEDWHIAKSGYDMTMDILENNDGQTRLELGLQKQLYSMDNANTLMDGYVNLLTAFANNPEVNWNLPEVWREETVMKALDAGRGKSIEHTWGPTMAHRVEEMIQQNGTAVALKDGSGREITYSEMGSRVDDICSALTKAKATNGAKVGVFQQPSSDWICSLLAIFRAGAVYVPLDLRTPLQRLAAIAKEAQPAAILADEQTFGDVKALDTPSASVIKVSNLPSAQSTQNLAQAGAPACLLFTSGSTGTPKGIHINHSNIVKQVEGYSKLLNVQGSGARVLQQSAYSFDKSLQQIFLALAHGSALHIVPEEKRGDPVAQAQIIAQEGITTTTATPSEYLMWFRYAKDSLEQASSWKFALLGGESVTEPLLEEFRQHNKPMRVVNSYGPAEITMSCAKGVVPYDSMYPGEPAVAGFTIPGYSTYIVDDQLRPLPLGFTGEIVISGPGVGDGYLKNDELTKQKFLPDVFGGSGRMYRTGDKGRLTADGAVYCEGRLEGDTQIKLRGVRMELEDIENTILQASKGALERVVVTLRGDDENAFLAAHVVPTGGQDVTDLINRLPTSLPLPQYMIPSAFVPIDSMPLTSHLKVDRKAVRALSLPELEKAAATTSGDLSATETKLASIWNDIIPGGAPALGADANFFYVGGNSLLLVKLHAIIRKELNANLPLIKIMNNATLSNMAGLIDDVSKISKIDWKKETSLPDVPTANGITAKPKKQTDLTVMVTGATGVLGRQVIPRLASDPRISKVYAVAVRGEGRIPDTTGKVVVKQGDLDSSLLGMSIPDAAALSNEVDVILHLGANRSFWDSYYQLRSTNVSAVKEIINFANARKASIHFVSSGGVSSYATSTPPEDGSDGYVASKWAAETLLGNAAKRFGLDCVIHRPTKTQDISAAPPEILDELLGLAHKLEKRPILDGLAGSLGIVPLQQMAGNIAEALFDGALSHAGETSVIPQMSALNVDVEPFAEKLKQDKEVLKYEGLSALKWMGLAKKSGWSQFMVGQDLVMSKEGDQVVSSR